MDIQSIKQRFSIIGSSTLLNRAIDIASQVAPTDLTVFITGESGFLKAPSILNFSDMKKAPSPVPMKPVKAISRW